MRDLTSTFVSTANGEMPIAAEIEIKPLRLRQARIVERAHGVQRDERGAGRVAGRDERLAGRLAAA